MSVFGPYVLIFIMHTAGGKVALMTQEFTTQERCEVTKALISRSSESARRSITLLECTPK